MMVDQVDTALAGGSDTRMRAGDGQVGQVAVNRLADVSHGLQALVPVGHGEQRAAVVALESLQLLRNAGLQPDHVATFAQLVTIGGRKYRAGTGGKQYPGASAAFIQQVAFALAKTCLALDLEHGTHVDAAMLFDLLIEIDEQQAIMRSKASSDGRLAGAGRTDDEKIARRIHGQMLAGRVRSLWGAMLQ
jgi:hypothetical protein